MSDESRNYKPAAASELPANEIRQIRQRIAVVDKHHAFGDDLCEFGPVFHEVKSFDQNSWEMVTEATLRFKKEYDVHTARYLAEKIDWLTRGPLPTYVEIVARITTRDDQSLKEQPQMYASKGVDDVED